MRLQTLRNIRDVPRVGAFVALETGSPVCNLATGWGWYFRGEVRDGRVWVRRARWFIPPFDLEQPVSAGGDDRYPALLREARERLWCLWQTGESGVYQAFSDDDGESWSSSEMLFPGAKFPRADTCPVTGTIVYAAYAVGTIMVRIQAPGDEQPREMRAVQGFESLAEEVFDVRWDYSGQRRLIFVVNSGSSIEEYVSTDPEAETVTVARVA